MQLFYITDIQGNVGLLGEEESWHCTRVLRLQEGSPIHMTDGKGNLYDGILTRLHHKGCLVEITKSSPGYGAHPWHLQIAIAPTKNIDRFEWFLEKSAEIGIDSIVPLLCDHSERDTIKAPRLEKVLVAAMKQSLKAYLPVLHPMKKFSQVVAEPFGGKRLIATCSSASKVSLQDAYAPGEHVQVFIGPEGDFSSEEISLAGKAGLSELTLGESRLRTETAGIVVCAAINMINNGLR